VSRIINSDFLTFRSNFNLSASVNENLFSLHKLGTNLGKVFFFLPNRHFSEVRESRIFERKIRAPTDEEKRKNKIQKNQLHALQQRTGVEAFGPGNHWRAVAGASACMPSSLVRLTLSSQALWFVLGGLSLHIAGDEASDPVGVAKGKA